MEAILHPQAAGHVNPATRRSIWDRRFAPVALYLPIVVITAAVHWLFEDPVITLYVGGTISMLIHIALGFIEARRCELWFSPLSFYFFFYSINLGLSAIHIGRRISAEDVITFSVVTVYPDNLASAYIIYLVGSLALHFGMQILRPLRGEHQPVAERNTEERNTEERNTEERNTEERNTERLHYSRGFLILWFLGMARRVWGDFASQLGAISGVFNWACLAALSAYALSYESKRRGPMFWTVLGMGIAVEIVMNLGTGSKAYIMFSFIPVLWLFARERSLRRWLPILGTAFAIIYLTIVQPVVMTARITGGQSDESVGARITRVYMQGTYTDVSTDRDQRSDFLDRQFDPVPVGFLHREVERAGLRYGETMDYLAYAFIPRLLWPEKPTVTRGDWFTVYLGQARTERDVTTSTGLTAIGELYWNFGIIGVTLGMMLLGLLRGFLWRLCNQHSERHPIRFLLYVSLVFSMSDMPEAGTVLVGSVYQLVVFGSTIWILDFIGHRNEARV